MAKLSAPTKDVMAQYTDLKIEIAKIKADIDRIEDSIAKLVEEGTVIDKVTGGVGGIQGFKIEGFPIREYNKRRKLLTNKRERLIKRETYLMEFVESIELYIDSLKSSRERNVFRMVFIENKTQQEVADILHVDRSLVSKIISKNL